VIVQSQTHGSASTDNEHLFATLQLVTIEQQSFDDLGTPLHQVTFVVLDVETTGASPSCASLTEVAAARYQGGELLGTFQTLVRPEESIPPLIAALTGISDEMVAEAPAAGEMLPSLLEFIGRSVVVGHNVRFDLSFLNQALVDSGREQLSNATVDTLALARRLIRDMVPNCKLGTLAACLRLDHQPSHRALKDVLATGDLLHALLERAGSFGIVELEELLALPRLMSHPQAGKLRLTTRLPHRPGVYWFTDAAGNVLYVGKATDLQTRVRSYFAGDKRTKVGRLLRQLHTIHHRVCPGPLRAAVIEGRLIRAWSPPYNKQGKARRRRPAAGNPPRYRGTRPRGNRMHGWRSKWNTEDLGRDPVELLSPMVDALVELSQQQRYEEAANVRDEVERLRALLQRHRRVESLRSSGRVILAIEGEGTVELDGGLLVDLDHRVDEDQNGNDAERAIVAQWLNLNSERVRILEVHSPMGISMPSDRIPTLSELCADLRCAPVDQPIPVNDLSLAVPVQAG
jgi:DNA polymerase III epsilon subunit family exonuclease